MPENSTHFKRKLFLTWPENKVSETRRRFLKFFCFSKDNIKGSTNSKEKDFCPTETCNLVILTFGLVQIKLVSKTHLKFTELFAPFVEMLSFVVLMVQYHKTLSFSCFWFMLNF